MAEKLLFRSNPRKFFSIILVTWKKRNVVGSVKMEYFDQYKMRCLFQKLFKVYEIFRVLLRRRLKM